MKVAQKESGSHQKRGLAALISSGFGLGYLPGAPGTWGSLAGIPLGLLLLRIPIYLGVFVCFVLVFILSPVVKKAVVQLNHQDAPEIVVDEIIGQALTLLSLKKLALGGLSTIPLVYFIWAFFLFRIFDIFKPFPANLLDRQKTVFGLFGDDIVAGLYAGLVLRGLIRIMPAL
jgi:phosphatidylglycerophosphatase A